MSYGLVCPVCTSKDIDFATGDCPCCRHEIMSCYCRQCGHMFFVALGYPPVSLGEVESVSDGPSL